MRRGLLLLFALLLGGVTAALAANPEPPTVTTGSATNVATTTATILGTINPGDADTTWQFRYGTSTTYGLTTPVQTIPAATTVSTVTAPLDKLTAGTTYHYQLTATNAAGQNSGDDKNFKTLAPPPLPGASTGNAKNVGRNTATLTGSVDPNGLATQFFFEYGTTKSYGVATPAASAGSGQSSKSVSQDIGGLTPDTVVHFRIVAVSSAGTSRGNDHSFRTAKLPTTIAIGASPDPVVFGNDVTIEGRISGPAIVNRAVTLQTNPFPFTRGFKNFGSSRLSDASGVVRFAVAPFTQAKQFRVKMSGAASAVVTVEVRPKIRLRVRRIRGKRVRVSGFLNPGDATGVISIQRRTAGGSFVPIRRVALEPHAGGARFRTTLRFRRNLALRASYRAPGGPLLAAVSRVKRAL